MPLLGTTFPAGNRQSLQNPQKSASFALALTAFGWWRPPTIGRNRGPFWGSFGRGGYWRTHAGAAQPNETSLSFSSASAQACARVKSLA